MPAITPAAVWAALDDVKDPEIPVVSVVELGIVQSVSVDADRVTVAITPTFTGCPALHVMRAEIADRVLALGATSVDVPVVLDPPWTSDRIAPAARERMRSIGLAPPPPARRAFRADIDLAPVPPRTADPTPEAGAPGASRPGGFDLSAGLASATGATFEAAPVACPFCGSIDTTVANAFGPTICRVLLYCHACQQPFEQFKPL